MGPRSSPPTLPCVAARSDGARAFSRGIVAMRRGILCAGSAASRPGAVVGGAAAGRACLTPTQWLAAADGRLPSAPTATTNTAATPAAAATRVTDPLRIPTPPIRAPSRLPVAILITAAKSSCGVERWSHGPRSERTTGWPICPTNLWEGPDLRRSKRSEDPSRGQPRGRPWGRVWRRPEGSRAADVCVVRRGGPGPPLLAGEPLAPLPWRRQGGPRAVGWASVRRRPLASTGSKAGGPP